MSPAVKHKSKDVRIIQAALRLFANEGYHAVSVPRIAEEAGVGIGSIYRIAESKSLLAKRVHDHVIDSLNNAIRVQSDDASTMSGKAFFWLHWRQFVDWVQSSPECIRFLLLYSLLGPGRDQARLEDIALLRSLLDIAHERDWLFTRDTGLLANVIIGPLALFVLNGGAEERLSKEILYLAGDATLRALGQD